MQDLNTSAGEIVMEKAPSHGGLPDGLAEKIAAADVLILLSSSESRDQALTVQTVLASPTFEPDTIASHAYAHAVQLAHQDLLRHVRGEPTDADRYRALRDFAVLPGSDPARFEVVNAMLQRFEETNPNAGEHPTQEEAERMADFLVHALENTTAAGDEQQLAST